MPIAWRVSGALLAAGLLAGCAVSGHQLPEISDTEKSAAIAEIGRAASLLPTARTAAANELIARNVMRRLQPEAQKLCKELEREGCWYTLEFSPKGKMNAYVYKNQVVLYNGLAQYLQNDDEFSVVLAHEIGHHIAGHYEESLQNRAVGSIIGGLIFAGIAAASGAYQNSPYAAQSDMETAMKLGEVIGKLSFSKEQEREADYLSAYLTARAGYNPEKGSPVWIKLAKTSNRTETYLLDSHPAGPDRLAAWHKSVQEVRYSADFMPNLAGAKEEPKLQVARTFADPEKGIYPEGSIMASLPPPSWELNKGPTAGSGVETAIGAKAVAAPSPSGTFEPLFVRKPQASPGSKPGNPRGSAMHAAAVSPEADRVITTQGVWQGSGTSESCGANWQLRLEQLGFELGGQLVWNGLTYAIQGKLDSEGRSIGARATRSADASNASTPQRFEIDVQLYLDQAHGWYKPVVEAPTCAVSFRIARS